MLYSVFLSNNTLLPFFIKSSLSTVQVHVLTRSHYFIIIHDYSSKPSTVTFHAVLFHLKRNVRVLLLDFWHFLCSQHSEVIADLFSGILWVNDIIYKSTLGCNHWIGKTSCVLCSVCFKILKKIMTKRAFSA